MSIVYVPRQDTLFPFFRPDRVSINKKKIKENFPSSRFCHSSRPQSENEKRNNYLDLARGKRKLRNMRVTMVIPIVGGILGMVPLSLVGWVLWHINLCRFFNVESIFM